MISTSIDSIFAFVVVTFFLTTFGSCTSFADQRAYSRRNVGIPKHHPRRIKAIYGRGKGGLGYNTVIQNCGGVHNNIDYVQEVETDDHDTNDLEISEPVQPLIDDIMTNTFYIDPCTGAVSQDSNFDSDDTSLPCLKDTNMPSSKTTQHQFPTSLNNLKVEPKLVAIPAISLSPSPSLVVSSEPTISSVPSKSIIPSLSYAPTMSTLPTSSYVPTMSTIPSVSFPSISPTSISEIIHDETQMIENISCPGVVQICDGNDDGRSVAVEFKYKVETTSTINDPNTVLPQLEKSILYQLVVKLLDHCILNNTLVSIFNMTDGNYRHSPRKENEVGMEKRLEDAVVVGICSNPKDSPLGEETCNPELDSSNSCFVINGGVTISVDTNTFNEKNMKGKVLNATEEIMDKDQILTQDNPELKKVTFIEDENVKENVGTVEQAAGDPNISLMVGASLAALASLLGLYIVKKHAISVEKRSNTTSSNPLIFPSPTPSLIPPDSKDIGKQTSCMNVHECKSASCQKCYVNNKDIEFIQVEPHELFDIESSHEK